MNDLKIEDRAAEREQEKREDLFDLYKNTVKDIRYILRQYGRDHPQEALEAIAKLVGNPKLQKTKTKGRL